MVAVATIAKQVEDAIRRPKIAAIKLGASKLGKSTKHALKDQAADGDTKRKLEIYREGLVPHFNTDLGDLAAITAYSYDYLLSMTLVSAGDKISLRRIRAASQKKGNNPKEFPLSFLIRDEVDQAAEELDDQISRLHALRGVFSSAIPASMVALTAVDWFSFKAFVAFFSSLRAGDIILQKQVLETCENAVEVIDTALEWAEQRRATIEEWQDAHKNQQQENVLR